MDTTIHLRQRDKDGNYLHSYCNNGITSYQLSTDNLGDCTCKKCLSIVKIHITIKESLQNIAKLLSKLDSKGE